LRDVASASVPTVRGASTTANELIATFSSASATVRAHRPAIVSQPLSWDRISTITRGADITDVSFPVTRHNDAPVAAEFGLTTVVQSLRDQGAASLVPPWGQQPGSFTQS
jgi:hypothetical protein